MSMTERVVVITGASRGIGAATARAFAAQGDKVVLLARSRSDLRAVAAEIGKNALAIPCDIRDYAQVEQAVLAGVDTFGGCDVLVCNGGAIEPIAPIESADPKAWAAQIDTNLTGLFNPIRASLHLMLAAGGGTVLSVSSGAAHRAMEGWSGYCASKAGAAMLMDSLHLEYGTRGIRALGLSPGTVATDMQRRIKSSGVGPVAELSWDDHVPPEWPAKALVYLASPDADDLCGTEAQLRDPDLRARVGLE